MATIVIRLWEPALPPGAGDAKLRGVVDVVGEGESSTFVGEEELLTLIRRVAEGHRQISRLGDC